jgi:hypothetical protein
VSVSELLDVLTGLPADALLPVGWVREQLRTDAPGAADPDRLWTLRDLAERYSRSVGAVRGWCEAGRFSGAFKLNGRAWRVPDAALDAFNAAQAQPGRTAATAVPVALQAGQRLSDWRRKSRPA